MNPRVDQKRIAKMQPYLRQLFIAGSALLAVGLYGVDASYAADPTPKLVTSAVTAATRSVKVGLNKSLVIDLPRDARDYNRAAMEQFDRAVHGLSPQLEQAVDGLGG